MKETRRVLCAVMAALVILTAPMTSYTEARAADVVLRPGGEIGRAPCRERVLMPV